MYTMINSGRPGYLFDELIVPAHRPTTRASSFFVQGAILWNGGIDKFREGCLSHLLRSPGSSSSENNDKNIGFE
jgi:hypothetical protein